jgi:uncharacterized protein (DUF302 family)
MEQQIEVRHISLEVKADFENFTKIIEKCLGRFEYSLYAELDTDPQAVERLLKQAAGEEGLMLFNIQDHGKLLKIFGTPRKAKQYVLGNPLIAITMTRHDIRAAGYAPLRMLVYEAEDKSTRVEYDQPSSLFGQFDNAEVTAVARSLDSKLANLIKKAELAAIQHRAASKSIA